MINLRSSGTEIKVDFVQFAGGERHVQIHDDITSSSVINIIARIRTSNDLMDYLLLENAITQAAPQAEIQLTLPYLPYARQDRVCAAGQAFSLSLFAQLMKLVPKTRIAVWDCHSKVGAVTLNAINVPPTSLIAQSAQLTQLLQQANCVLVCPDKGAIDRCTSVKEFFGVGEMVVCRKVRNPTTGKIESTEVDVEELSGKSAVIVDDICDGGATFTGIAEALRQKGCNDISLYVTHGIFSKGLNVFNGLINRIYTTDSIYEARDHDVDIPLTVINIALNEGK